MESLNLIEQVHSHSKPQSRLRKIAPVALVAGAALIACLAFMGGSGASITSAKVPAFKPVSTSDSALNEA